MTSIVAEKITVSLTDTAQESLHKIQDRMCDVTIDEIVSAALVIYDMHQASMVERLEEVMPTRQTK